MSDAADLVALVVLKRYRCWFVGNVLALDANGSRLGDVADF